jgi:xanthine dehydrogenase accessory factor
MKDMIIVRGGEQLESAVIHRLVSCGFNVLVTVGENPSFMRRGNTFCEAAFDGEARVDGVGCLRVQDVSEAEKIFDLGMAALVIDDGISNIKADILIDMYGGCNNIEADYKIALGGGYLVGKDADCVVEISGDDAGKVLYEGYARADIYRDTDGEYSTSAGRAANVLSLGDEVRRGSVITKIGYADVCATKDGFLSAIIREGCEVRPGMKVAEILPDKKDCFMLSMKNRCISGGVLEAVVRYYKERL